MGYRIGAATLPFALGLIGCGSVGTFAWNHGHWGLLAGATLVAAWLVLRDRWRTASPAAPAVPTRQDKTAEDAMVLRVLLDSAPTPLLAVDAGAVRALNRTARRLFATDDRVLPPPPALDDRAATHLRHEGRNWRIDRVDVARAGRMVVALIDIEREERVAEARATAELIHVLGHELLNGLAPIVSLAESGLAAVDMPDAGRALLPEILGTLARRAEALRRFTEAYRILARLPEPMLRPVPVAPLAGDLARLFAGRWPGIALSVDIPGDLHATADRDQLEQALWAVLQNAAEAAMTGDAPPHVTLRARSGTAIIIDIGDSGTGVAADDGGRIFRPFHTTKPDGTGIGLSLARQIVHAHGGTLALQPSVPTTFRLTLPIRP